MWRRTPSLRERFRVAGPDFFSDQEMLELALLSVMTAGKARRLARLLIDRFDGFSEVIDADRTALQAVPGMTEEALFRIILIKDLTHRMIHGSVRVRRNLSKRSAVLDYLTETPAPNDAGARVLFLDKKDGLIEDRCFAPIIIKDILHVALQCGAMGLVLAGVDAETAEAIDQAGVHLKVTVKHFFPPVRQRESKLKRPRIQPSVDHTASDVSAYQEKSAEFVPNQKSKLRRQKD